MEFPVLDTTALRSGSRVLVTADFNVPLDHDGVADDRRIRATLPTLTALRDAGQRIVICAHLGRPGGGIDPDLSLAPVADHLRELLSSDVELGPRGVVGDQTEAAADRLDDGDVMLLENLRFHPGERACDGEFVEQLCRLADAYVNDAFAVCHRAHASIVGPPGRLPSAGGRLIQREVDVLGRLRDNAQRPFVAVLGGSKVADKLDVVESLAERCDHVLIGGAMCFTFLAAAGHDVGASPVEQDAIDRCRDLLDSAAIELPIDVVAAEAAKEGVDHRTVSIDEIPDGWVGTDIGPETSVRFGEFVGEASSVFWNGPMGIFEIDEFAHGSRDLAEALAKSQAFVVVGGGDTGSAISRFGVSEQIDHVSTGGGAALRFLTGDEMPGLRALGTATPLR